VPASPRPYVFGRDGFVVRLGSSGTPKTGMLLGGSNGESVRSVATNAIGDVFAAGSTASGDFPRVAAIAGSSGTNSAVFVARLRGNTIDFSTLLSGSNATGGGAVAVAPDGGAWVGGYTWSTDFPVVNPIHPTHWAGSSDGFVTKIEGLDPYAVTQTAT